MISRRLARFKKSDEETGNILILMGVFIVFFLTMSILSPKIFLSLATMRSMFVQLPEFGIYAFAMMLAMITGGIDLSIVSTGNLASIVASYYMIDQLARTDHGSESLIIAGGILIALSVGALCGSINGISISVIGIPPMLATLATMQIFDGISLILTQGASVQGLPELFAQIGAKTIFNAVPVTMIAFLIISTILYYIQSRTRLGVCIYMLGSNPVASEYSGINNSGVTVLVYAISGLLAAIAGIILTSRSMSARMNYGSIYQLQAILAVVLGGISPKGGKGKVMGVVFAVLSLQILSTGLNILNIAATSYVKNLVWGFLLIFVLILKYYLNRRNKSRKGKN